MKIAITKSEGGSWHKRNYSPKAVANLLHTGKSISNEPVAAVKLIELGLIYDFILASKHKELNPWRTE